MPQVGSSNLSTSSSPMSEISLGSGELTASSLKHAIIQRFGPLTLDDSVSAYRRGIEPWFPIISIPMLQRSRLSPTWEEISLDVALLCLSVILLTTSPPLAPENGSGPREFKSLYCHVKNSISSTEVLGLNSFQIVQSRILVTLYEVAHGLYPAAYISIGATINAADALVVHPGAGAQSSHATEDEAAREDSVLIWCGILVLDRYGFLNLTAQLIQF